jgi:hypothetical protein
MANHESQPGKRIHQVDALNIVSTTMRDQLALNRLGDSKADARAAALLLDLISRKPDTKKVIFESGKMDD